MVLISSALRKRLLLRGVPDKVINALYYIGKVGFWYVNNWLKARKHVSCSSCKISKFSESLSVHIYPQEQ